MLERATLDRARSERQVVEAVAAARSKGVSWARIGAVLGTSAQAAPQRYGTVVESARRRSAGWACNLRAAIRRSVPVVQSGPWSVSIGPMADVELERVEVLELLGMVLAHLNDAEARREMSARVPMLMGIRAKLAASLQEDQ